jgi:uncharacterized protein (TIGR03437 family)
LEVDPTGSQVVYGTWFGPEYYATSITSIAINSDGSLYFAGATNAPTFQATAGAYLSTPGGGFVAQFTPGSTALSAFSFLPFQSPLGCGSGPDTGSVYCGNVALSISSGTQTAYVLFQANGSSNAGGVVELTLPALGAVSPTSSYLPNAQTGFVPSSLALASPLSVWVVGRCMSCAPGNMISGNALQPAPQSTGENAVVFQVTDLSPAISVIGGSATGTSPFSPGQLISIYGTQLGPPGGSGAQIGLTGAVTNANSGTQVFFNGVAGPILYTGVNQVNTAVPCSAAGQSSAQVSVQYLGVPSPPVTIPLAAAAPGIFTLNGSSAGEAAILNQDDSLNGPSNPAARGSAVAFYATGIGPTSPCVDGQTYQANLPMATLAVTASVGNIGAQVLYAGQAPYFMTGVAQINIVIPADAPTGVVPLTLLVNGVSSPSGVTIAVK